MTLKKYIKPILIFAVIYFLITAGFMATASLPGFLSAFPIDSLGIQFLYIFTMIWVSAIIGGVLFGYILGPFFLIVHKKVIGRKMVYGVQNLMDPNPDKFKKLLQGLFPALMALNFALMFSNNPAISQFLFGENYNPNAPEVGVTLILTLLALLPIMTGVSCALFSPVWFLTDAGIVYSNKEKTKIKRLPLEVRSVGGWYLYLLKGYAGISVLFSFYNLLVLYFSTEEISGNIVLFPALPLLIAIFIIPTAVILDITTEKRKAFLLKYAKKIGIIDKVAVSFEKTAQ